MLKNRSVNLDPLPPQQKQLEDDTDDEHRTSERPKLIPSDDSVEDLLQTTESDESREDSVEILSDEEDASRPAPRPFSIKVERRVSMLETDQDKVSLLDQNDAPKVQEIPDGVVGGGSPVNHGQQHENSRDQDNVSLIVSGCQEATEEPSRSLDACHEPSKDLDSRVPDSSDQTKGSQGDDPVSGSVDDEEDMTQTDDEIQETARNHADQGRDKDATFDIISLR